MQTLPDNVTQENSALKPFVEGAFRHRRLWLMGVVGVILTTLLYTLLTPKQYRSEMSILVQNARGSYQVTPQKTTNAPMESQITEEQINSEIEVLRSRSLADVVVDPQWKGRPISSMSAQQLKAHDQAVEKFNKHLSVDLVRKSNVIHVAYTASDPRTASETLGRLLSAFLAKQQEIGHPPGTAKFFTSEADRYKKDLDVALQQLSDYQQKQRLVSLSDREQSLDRDLAQAQNELRSTDAQISEVSQRLGEQVHQLKGVSPRQETVQRTIPNDYSVERLNTLLAELQNKRTTLLTQFNPSDRLVQEVDQQIVNTNAALKNAQKMRSEEHSSDVNPVWQQVTGSIVQNQSERKALQGRHDELIRQIDQLQSELSGVERATVSFTTLRQRVTDLENNYQLYTQKRDEAQIADAMDESKLLDVAVAQSPTFAITPFRPKPVTNLIFGTFTAVFLASFMVFFAETGRATIATPRELAKLSRYPLLATVPLDLNAFHGPEERSVDSARLSIILAPEANEEQELRSVFAKETKAS